MFIDFGLKDFLDIVLVGLLLYYIYKLMKSSGSINIFTGILIFVLLWVIVSQVLEMRLLGSIMDKLINVGVIGIIILFQDEIRHFLFTLGSRKGARGIVRWLTGNKKDSGSHEELMPVIMACMNMSKKKVGALIVMERHIPLDDITKTGETIDANINQLLIENIFFKNSPLHDGAMVVSRNRIKAAGCILPIAHDTDIPKELGLRHRAALGMSQSSDAKIIIVSEETGSISLAYQGEFKLKLTAEEMERLLSEE